MRRGQAYSLTLLCLWMLSLLVFGYGLWRFGSGIWLLGLAFLTFASSSLLNRWINQVTEILKEKIMVLVGKTI